MRKSIRCLACVIALVVGVASCNDDRVGGSEGDTDADVHSGEDVADRDGTTSDDATAVDGRELPDGSVDGRELPDGTVDGEEVGPADTDASECPELAVQCTDFETDQHLVSPHSVDPPTTSRIFCTVDGVGREMPTWTTYFDDVFFDSGRTPEYTLWLQRPGETVVHASVPVAEQNCDATPFTFRIAPPPGLSVSIWWFSSEARDADFDIHVVRDGFCFEDPDEDLYYVTRDREFNWGDETRTDDDPVYPWDSRSTPGAEWAGIHDPSDSETIHVGVRAATVRSTFPNPRFRYAVYFDRARVGEGSFELERREYATLGALRGGEWIGTQIEEQADGTECPRPADP